MRISRIADTVRSLYRFHRAIYHLKKLFLPRRARVEVELYGGKRRKVPLLHLIGQHRTPTGIPIGILAVCFGVFLLRK